MHMCVHSFGFMEEGVGWGFFLGCLQLRVGKHAYYYCRAIGLREMKPITFGSLKAEGNETNKALGY